MMNSVDTKEPTLNDADKWPNTIRNKKELDLALDEGVNSGASSKSILEVADQVLNRLKNG